MTVRALALRALLAVEQGKTLEDALLEVKAKEADRGLLTELVYGVTRQKSRLDHVLACVSRHPLDQVPVPTRVALRLGVYQLLCLDRIPASAAVNESVKLVRKWGHPGLVKLANALLRKVAQHEGDWPWPDPAIDPVRHLAVRYSLPDWLAKTWFERWGLNGAQELAAAMLQPAPVWIRLNRLKQTCVPIPGEAGPVPQAWRSGLTGDPATWPGFQAGCFYVQDLGSQMVGVAVDPKPQERVIDLCAAPGGKSTQLAERMGDVGEVVAVERDPRRAARIEDNKRRLGTTCVRVEVGDARTRALAPADRVLVDAPCSGLGVLRRKPDIKWQPPRPHLPALQLDLLRHAAGLVKPGGVLVYSTCTLMEEENEAVVQAFLAEHPAFRADDWAHLLPEAWQDDVQNGMIQLLPHRHGSDGFFMARLRRDR